MDKELKIKWIKALRSGRYKQARRKLKVGKAYCCLGVLCRVARLKINADGDSVGHGGDYQTYKPIFDLIDDEEFARQLAALNDDKRSSFNAIADKIESELPALRARSTMGEKA